MSKILEVIRYKNNYGIQTFLILDKMPEHKFERRGNLIFSNVDGFTESYVQVLGTRGAFAGRHFDISMKDGSTIEATGDIWSAGQSEAAEKHLTSVGIATLEKLANCYVFTSSYVDTARLEQWIDDHPDKVSHDYWKYDIKRAASMQLSKENKKDA